MKRFIFNVISYCKANGLNHKSRNCNMRNVEEQSSTFKINILYYTQNNSYNNQDYFQDNYG